MENTDRTQNQGGRTGQGGSQNEGGRQGQGGQNQPGQGGQNRPGQGGQNQPGQGGKNQPGQGGRQSGKGFESEDEEETGTGGTTDQRRVRPSDESPKTA